MSKEKSIIQSEGKAHDEDTTNADKAKKIHISEKAHKALGEKATVEGKTPDQKAAEIVEKKAKETEQTTFEGKINKYGFLHFSKELYESLGWAKGEDIAVKITKTANRIAVERT